MNILIRRLRDVVEPLSCHYEPGSLRHCDPLRMLSKKRGGTKGLQLAQYDLSEPSTRKLVATAHA